MKFSRSLILLLFVFFSSAQAYGPNAIDPTSGEMVNPSKLLQAGFLTLREFFKEGQPQDKKMIELFVNEKLVPYFDFDYMTKWSAGRLYHQASPTQKAKMRGYLRQTFLSGLIKNLASYNSLQIKVGKTRPGRSRNEVLVDVWIRKAQGYIVKVRFRLYNNGHMWKVFDVSADGKSAMLHYRRYFQAQYRRQQQQRFQRSYQQYTR